MPGNPGADRKSCFQISARSHIGWVIPPNIQTIQVPVPNDGCDIAWVRQGLQRGVIHIEAQTYMTPPKSVEEAPARKVDSNRPTTVHTTRPPLARREPGTPTVPLPQICQASTSHSRPSRPDRSSCQFHPSPHGGIRRRMCDHRAKS